MASGMAWIPHPKIELETDILVVHGIFVKGLQTAVLTRLKKESYGNFDSKWLEDRQQGRKALFLY